MASSALAYDLEDRRFRAAPPPARPMSEADWQRKRQARIAAAEPNLSLRFKAAIFIGGGLLGWALPIALALLLV